MLSRLSGRLAGVQVNASDDTWQASVNDDLADWDERFQAKHGRPTPPSDGLWEQAADAMSLYATFHAMAKERYPLARTPFGQAIRCEVAR